MRPRFGSLFTRADITFNRAVKLIPACHREALARLVTGWLEVEAISFAIVTSFRAIFNMRGYIACLGNTLQLFTALRVSYEFPIRTMYYGGARHTRAFMYTRAAEISIGIFLRRG